jgi:hypothetical protein
MGVILSTSKDLFLPFKGQARILRRLRLLRMTEAKNSPQDDTYMVVLSECEGPGVVFKGVHPRSFVACGSSG